jgi:hypothetical protein
VDELSEEPKEQAANLLPGKLPEFKSIEVSSPASKRFAKEVEAWAKRSEGGLEFLGPSKSRFDDD